MQEEKHYYHCATKGFEDSILFSSNDSFIAGMNRVGLCRLLCPDIIIISFVLMDNHVHFILHGTNNECKVFMSQFKRLTEIWLHHNDSNEKTKQWEIGCWQIQNREKLMEKICYVLRNPLAAGMRILPTNYAWGSGPLMFSCGLNDINRQGMCMIHGQLAEIGKISEYQRRKMFGTKLNIPENWMVNSDNLIWPGSYVAYKYAENIFGSIQNFMFELNKKNEDSINQEMYGAQISLHDNDVLRIARSASEDIFGLSDINILSIDQRLDLIRYLRKRYGTDIKQLGRLLHIKSVDLQQIFH